MKVHPSKETLSAYHEAGHAVLAVIFKIPIESVSIDEGEIRYREDSNIFVTLAGAFAAQHIDKLALTAWDDLEKAKEMLKQGENLEDYERQTKQLVEKNKDKIDILAKELIKKRVLTGQEVKNIIF